jgi:Relaxase/Mobilisation nuclease domain
MPPGTSAEKVLRSVQRFAVNEFALKHRYAMVLHTDEAHPHVHLVMKAVSEQGERLNIRKETLRGWRQQFAEQLREQGIAANATERSVRGQDRTSKRDSIYRSMLRKRSTREHDEMLAIAKKDEKTLQRHRSGIRKLAETRLAVSAGWNAVAKQLEEEGNYTLAEWAQRFSDRMAPPRTDQQQLVERFNTQYRPRERGPVERTL